MPYSVQKKGDSWCVYNDDTGKKVGEHNDRTAAMRQMRALYANTDAGKEPEGKDEPGDSAKEEKSEKKKKKSKKGKAAPESDSDYED